MNFKLANNTPRFDSIDEIQIWILKELLANGERVSPQGKETLEYFQSRLHSIIRETGVLL